MVYFRRTKITYQKTKTLVHKENTYRIPILHIKTKFLLQINYTQRKISIERNVTNKISSQRNGVPPKVVLNGTTPSVWYYIQ
jgi:hypothetical protein